MAHAAAPPSAFSRASANRLTRHDLGRFEGSSLFAMLGRAVCEAGCLPRKELFEAWEMARRVRRRFRGGRVVDLAGGHGLLAQALLLLDDSSPSAVVVDPELPASAAKLQVSLVAVWPRLRDRIAFVAGDLEAVALDAGDLVVSCHACGGLTDSVLAVAVRAGARVAVLPCCHDLDVNDQGGLTGWVDGPLAVDVVRALRLKAQGYRIRTQSIAREITPKNRLLIGEPV